MRNCKSIFSSIILFISVAYLSGCSSVLSPEVKSFNDFVVKSEKLYEAGEITPLEHFSAYYEKVKILQTPIPAQKPVLLNWGLTMLEHAEDLADKKITRKEFDKLERRARLVLETDNSAVFEGQKVKENRRIRESIKSIKDSLPKTTHCTTLGYQTNCTSY